MRNKGTNERGQAVEVSLGDRSYDIFIKRGSLGEVGERLGNLGLGGAAAIVTNPVVGRLYGAAVSRALKAAGFAPHVITIPEGERAKTLQTVSKILDALAAARFERGSSVIALGGGVVGDIAGFAAAVYLRGVQFVQIPTTLIAQVDSSVGGKTGVNHRLGKNLIGSFYQPRLVLVDPATLETLPRREWVAGLAEVIKYGVIADEELFGYLESHIESLLKMADGPVAHVIRRSCEIKASVVAQDERESGLRRILNYGHTIGHALEALGSYRRLIHGEAVAIGMVQEAGLAHRLGICSEDVVHRQRGLVGRAGLPWALPGVRYRDLWAAMRHDKKVADGRVHCVFPQRIGAVRVAPLDAAAVKGWLADRASAAGNAGGGA